MSDHYRIDEAGARVREGQESHPTRRAALGLGAMALAYAVWHYGYSAIEHALPHHDFGTHATQYQGDDEDRTGQHQQP